MDQAWLRGGRPLRDGQAQFTTRIDASLRTGAVSSSAAARLRSDYVALVDLETRYAADGRISTDERSDLNARYNALTQNLESSPADYGQADSVAPGRAAFGARVDAAVAARRISRTEATRLKDRLSSPHPRSRAGIRPTDRSPRPSAPIWTRDWMRSTPASATARRLSPPTQTPRRASDDPRNVVGRRRTCGRDHAL